MYWTALILVALYLAIGWTFKDTIDEDDGGGPGSFIIILFWPFILVLWILIMALFLLPDSIIKWFKRWGEK